jgi:hypothetical protein
VQQRVHARRRVVDGAPVPDGGGPVERKERVLHTRVPESLDRHLKHRARNLGMSVSTVVRHVLLNTFGLVEDIVTDGTNVALSLAGRDVLARTARARGRDASEGEGEGDAELLGWQEVVLNRNAVCEDCNAVLRKGARAALGVHEGAGPRIILCRRCVDKAAVSDAIGRGRT